MYRTIVTICIAEWSLYLPHSCHYMYRAVVIVCTAQWSLYEPHSGHLCTAQWSLYVSPSGHYMYRPVVTTCIAQWSLYIPPNGHYMYRTVVTVCTTSLTFTIPRSAHTLYLCVLCGSQNKKPLFPYTTLTDTDAASSLRGTDCIQFGLKPSLTFNSKFRHYAALQTQNSAQLPPSPCTPSPKQFTSHHFHSFTSRSFILFTVYFNRRASGRPLPTDLHSS